MAVINLVGYSQRQHLFAEKQDSLLTLSGSQATALTAFLPKLFRVKLSFFALTSHTVTKPPLLPVTIICGTFLFQSRHSKSSALAAVLPRRKGFVTLLRSDMKSFLYISRSQYRHYEGRRTSPFAPAVANNSDLKGLNCSALTAPLCIDVRDM